MSKKPSVPKVDPALNKHLKTALPVAVDAALKAGALIKRKFGKFRDLQTKKDTSLVTEVDKGSEKIVLRALRKKFPNDTIVAEETGLSEGQRASPFRWHVDPLDGTTNFVHGFPFFCVSIGLEHEQNDFVLGVIHHPITGELYTGYRGNGAFCDKKRIMASKTALAQDALLSTGFSMRRDRFLEAELAAFGRLARGSHSVRRTGSAALDLIHVTNGQFDGFWERGLSSWDIVAGLSLLREAGGEFSRMDGKAFQLGDEGLLASNGLIHRELVDLLTGARNPALLL